MEEDDHILRVFQSSGPNFHFVVLSLIPFLSLDDSVDNVEVRKDSFQEDTGFIVLRDIQEVLDDSCSDFCISGDILEIINFHEKSKRNSDSFTSPRSIGE
jgi:hypothetical protein